MRLLKFNRNSPPFNAGETGGVEDAQAELMIQDGSAIEVDAKGNPVPIDPKAGPVVGSRVKTKADLADHAAVDARGERMAGEAPRSPSGETQDEHVPATGQAPAKDFHGAKKETR